MAGPYIVRQREDHITQNITRKLLKCDNKAVCNSFVTGSSPVAPSPEKSRKYCI